MDLYLSDRLRTKNVLFLVLVVFLLLLVTGVVVVKEAFAMKMSKKQVCYTNGSNFVYSDNPDRPRNYSCSNLNCERRTEQECNSGDGAWCCNSSYDGFMGGR